MLCKLKIIMDFVLFQVSIAEVKRSIIIKNDSSQSQFFICNTHGTIYNLDKVGPTVKDIKMLICNCRYHLDFISKHPENVLTLKRKYFFLQYNHLKP